METAFSSIPGTCRVSAGSYTPVGRGRLGTAYAWFRYRGRTEMTCSRAAGQGGSSPRSPQESSHRGSGLSLHPIQQECRLAKIRRELLVLVFKQVALREIRGPKIFQDPVNIHRLAALEIDK